MNCKTIVLTGGGSAGHVTPNLAIIEKLKPEGFELYYIGTENGIEKSIVTNIPYYSIEAGKLRRYLSKENIKDIFKIFKGYRQAILILKKINPDLVFSKGGFVSVPVVWAASKLNIPVILHESDFTPGLANKLCLKKAQKICLSFEPENTDNAKEVYTGSPVRDSLLHGNKECGMRFLGFEGNKPILLIMGGSLGAQAINDAADEALPELLEQYDIIQLRGKGNLNNSLNNISGYRQFEFIDSDLADVFATVDIAVSRAGANTIFEFLALNIPALLIPLPLSASRGDQILNAKYFSSKGYSHIIEQENLNAQSLIKSVNNLYNSRSSCENAMRESHAANGTENIIKLIRETLGAVCNLN